MYTCMPTCVRACTEHSAMIKLGAPARMHAFEHMLLPLCMRACPHACAHAQISTYRYMYTCMPTCVRACTDTYRRQAQTH